MNKTFDTVVSTVRQQPDETQEVVGRFVQAALAGDNVTLAEVEQRYRDEQTSDALAEVDRGEYVSLDDARLELKAQVEAMRR